MYGNIIKQERVSKKLTQGDLARLVGFKSASAIGMIEREEREPNIETLKNISLALHVSLEYLLGLSSFKDKPPCPELFAIGQIIREYRESNNLSILDLSNSSGIDYLIIDRIEQGIDPYGDSKPMEPPLMTLEKIRNFIGISEDKFYIETNYYSNIGDYKLHKYALDIIPELIEYLESNPNIVDERLISLEVEYDCGDNFAQSKIAYFEKIMELNYDEVFDEIHELHLQYSFDKNKPRFSPLVILSENDIEALTEEATLFETIMDVKVALNRIMQRPGLILNGEMLSKECLSEICNGINIGIANAEDLQNRKKIRRILMSNR